MFIFVAIFWENHILLSMKIILTLSEAIEKLQRSFSGDIAGDIQVEITGINTSWVDVLNSSISSLRYWSDEKIRAIKLLRELSKQYNLYSDNTAMGLADAKYAVENWHDFVRFITNNGRLPVRDFYTNGMK